MVDGVADAGFGDCADPDSCPSGVAGRSDHRQDACMDGFGERRPSVDDHLQIRGDVRRFRFECYRICARVGENRRIPWEIAGFFAD